MPSPDPRDSAADQQARLQWYADNPPYPRILEDIPRDEASLNLWRRSPRWHNGKRIFPPYKWHVKACRALQVKPCPPWEPGIPENVLKKFLDSNPRKSYRLIYDKIFNISFYSTNMKMRVSEFSIGLLIKLCGYSEPNIKNCLCFLRKGRWIRRVWRGRPNPEDPRYLHSCYELPVNWKHVQAWRIHKGKPHK
jgi:hypothetical protein